jgi:putative nucleotidyltransferase with HDIG domain
MNSYNHLYDLLSEQPIELPVFHSIALDLLHQLAEPDINYFNVIKTIKKDAALSMQVLKMSNSASYMGLVKCETIEKSAIRLGIQQVANLAIAASHGSLHSSDNLVVNEIMQYLWQHSHACALGCRSIASMTGHQSFADHAYMAGLLHDIGKLYLVKAVENISNDGQLGFVLDRDVLHGVFSEMHVEFGCRIMDHWNIPGIYRNIVANHHAEVLDPDDFLLAIVRLVNSSSRQFNVNLYPTEHSQDEIDATVATIQNIEINLPALKAVMTGRQESAADQSP